MDPPPPAMLRDDRCFWLHHGRGRWRFWHAVGPPAHALPDTYLSLILFGMSAFDLTRKSMAGDTANKPPVDIPAALCHRALFKDCLALQNIALSRPPSDSAPQHQRRLVHTSLGDIENKNSRRGTPQEASVKITSFVSSLSGQETGPSRRDGVVLLHPARLRSLFFRSRAPATTTLAGLRRAKHRGLVATVSRG